MNSLEGKFKSLLKEYASIADLRGKVSNHAVHSF